MRAWNRKPFQWTGQLPGGPALGAVNLTDKAGTCREFAHGVVYLMRAAGIPAGVDVVPIRGENSAGHLWPFIISKEGRTYVTCTENTDFVPAPEFDIVAAKIYRQKFGLNRRLDSSLPADRNGRPGFFTLPKLTDVTREYKPDGCGDVTIRDIAPGEGALPRLLGQQPLGGRRGLQRGGGGTVQRRLRRRHIRRRPHERG